MRISIIVAVADNGVIGRNGDLPWRMPSDLRRFRALTMGKPVVMGRRTWQSLPKALDGRDNIVVTRDRSFTAPGIEVVGSLGAALDLAAAAATRRGGDEIMVIGGGEIYAAALPAAQRIYLTRVHVSPQGDTTFPDPDPAEWQVVAQEVIPQAPKDDAAATLLIYERTNEPAGSQARS